MKKLLLAVLVAVIGLAPAFALAQTQAEVKMLVGRVQSVHPGALEEGTLVVAMYREQENGDKILTRLSLGESVPAPARPIEPPKQRL